MDAERLHLLRERVYRAQRKAKIERDAYDASLSPEVHALQDREAVLDRAWLAAMRRKDIERAVRIREQYKEVADLLLAKVKLPPRPDDREMWRKKFMEASA